MAKRIRPLLNRNVVTTSSTANAFTTLSQRQILIPPFVDSRTTGAATAMKVAMCYKTTTATGCGAVAATTLPFTTSTTSLPVLPFTTDTIARKHILKKLLLSSSATAAAAVRGSSRRGNSANECANSLTCSGSGGSGRGPMSIKEARERVRDIPLWTLDVLGGGTGTGDKKIHANNKSNNSLLYDVDSTTTGGPGGTTGSSGTSNSVHNTATAAATAAAAATTTTITTTMSTGSASKEHEQQQLLVLRRCFVARNFVSAMAFLQRVADVAEAANHHPDLHLTQWRNVELVIHTHSIAGLTPDDFELAKRLDALPVEYSPKFARNNGLHN